MHCLEVLGCSEEEQPREDEEVPEQQTIEMPTEWATGVPEQQTKINPERRVEEPPEQQAEQRPTLEERRPPPPCTGSTTPPHLGLRQASPIQKSAPADQTVSILVLELLCYLILVFLALDQMI